jgi:phenylpropionate dioxygenase-like ring-hydroxylating dioxygenase large terminal subunit
MNQATDPWARHWALATDPALGPASVDADRYVSPAVFQAEGEKIFRRVWLLVGRESEVPGPGDFIKRTIHPLSVEALIVRGRDSRLRAFHNVCPHRGSALVREDQGTRNAFVCPYHAWSFATDGACVAITAPEYFPQVDQTNTRLAAIHAEVWNGFIFLNFAERPQQSLSDYLGAFGELYAEVPFHEFKHCVESVQDIAANWKSLLDAFSESYHVGVLHKKSLPQMTTPTNPLSIYYDTHFLAPHASFIAQSDPDWQPTGHVLKFLYSVAANAVVCAPSGDWGPPAATNLVRSEGVNPLGLPQFGLRVLNIFPITQVQIFSDSYNVLQYWPVSTGKTRVVIRRYARWAPRSYFEAFVEAYGRACGRDVLAEDIPMTEQQQIALQGGGLPRLHFGEHEPILRFFHRMVEDHLNDRVTFAAGERAASFQTDDSRPA